MVKGAGDGLGGWKRRIWDIDGWLKLRDGILC